MEKPNLSQMVSVVPFTEQVAQSDVNWFKKLENAIETVDGFGIGIVEVEDLEKFPPHFMELIPEWAASKIRIYDSKIYVRANESVVHRRCVAKLENDIDQSSYCRNKNYIFCEKNSLILVNKFNCGTLVKKIPDALLGLAENGDTPKICLEVAFTHQSSLQLYLQSIHTLTEYTTLEYSFAIKVHCSRSNNHFFATFFGMKRTESNPPADPKELPSLIGQIYQEQGIVPRFHCNQQVFDDFPIDDPEKQIQKYGVEVFFTRQIWEANFSQDFVIDFEPPAIGNITIHGSSIAHVREYYQIWWRRRYGLSTS
jgi:hypothetical protein